MPIELDTRMPEGTKIRVVGIGGGGCNAVDNMILKGIDGVDMLAANTDMQSLELSKAERRINLGRKLTGGKGAGANPDVGRDAAEESADEIKESLKGSDMIFVTCGMGGGTGTGGAPVIARIGKEIGSLVVSIVTKPFFHEGSKKMKFADEGIKELEKYSDALIVIPNEKLFEVFDNEITLRDSFSKTNDILYNATRGISSIIVSKGMVNVDFADVRTVLQDKGYALMGFGRANGKNRAIEATQNALSSPLLEGVSITGATNALININAGSDFKLNEIKDILQTVTNAANNDINIIWGVVDTEEPSEEIRVIVIATGFNKQEEKKPAAVLFPDNKENVIKTNIINPAKTKGPITINDITSNPVIRSTGLPTDKYIKSNVLPRIPKGNDQLRPYGDPAIDRKPTNFQMEQIDKDLNQLERTNGHRINPEYSPSNKKLVEEPSLYRRKILD